ncbi:hypothetical protein BGZ74_001455 [Mortierella antarctica]|nr:hypothetical protein BGZ74_001455 [Mortierella antarctica]
MAPGRRSRAIHLPHPLILSLILPVLTHTQSPPPWKPAPAYHASSVFVQGQAFYVNGGYNINDSTVAIQTFSIDLSASFNVSSPPYTKLGDAPHFGRAMNTLLKDGQGWYFRANGGKASIYNLQTQTVSDAGTHNLIENATFTTIATVPGKGDIIFPTEVTTLTLRLVGNYLRADILQPSELSRSRLYALAPSNSAQAVFALAGFLDESNRSSSALLRFDAANSTWSNVELKEGAPSSRQGACMVPAHNGTKLVVFGGFPATTITNITNMPGDSLSDIYVLDAANLTWTKGQDGGEGRARSSHACAISGDSFIAWGGISTAGTPPAQILSVYDLKSNTWQDKFAPDPKLDSGSTSSGSNVGTIAGGIGAAVLLVARVDAKRDYVPSCGDLALRSPEAVYRHPQEDEMQAKERVLDEYRRRREVQLEQQRELDRQIEKELAEVQMLREKQSGTPKSAEEREMRGPQYWDIGSQVDLHRGSYFGASTLLRDGVTWLNILSSTQAASYNIQTAISTPSPSIPAFNNLSGLRAVTDAATDVIIPNGYSFTNTTSTYTMRYSSSTSTATPLLQSPDLNNLTFYAIAWSNSARAAFMFGGYYPSAQSDTKGLYRLDSDATSWTKLDTTGGPSARESACMVPANNGTKLVVFGGLLAPRTFLGDISIFDVTTSTWTRGQDGGETRTRTGHVCAVSGDKFVTWGGEGALTVSNPSKVEVVSVYSLTRDT